MSARTEMAERLLLTLWVGSLWAIGFIAAPVLFTLLDDRALAGSLAGEMFRATAYLGMACGVLLLVLQLLAARPLRWRFLVMLAMVCLVALGQFLVTPWMGALRADDLAESALFARLHGVASSLHLLVSVLGLVLVIAPVTNKR